MIVIILVYILPVILKLVYICILLYDTAIQYCYEILASACGGTNTNANSTKTNTKYSYNVITVLLLIVANPSFFHTVYCI